MVGRFGDYFVEKLPVGCPSQFWGSNVLLENPEISEVGKTLDDLTASWPSASRATITDPLAILNYDQIDSPKLHPSSARPRPRAA